jgi:phospholipid/cholesterol/gamma-HCH transport system substrate-binding protein
MSQRKDIRWSQLKVGILALTGVVLVAATIFLVSGSGGFWVGKARLVTYTPDAGGLKTGAVVRLAGVDVGNVRGVAHSGRSAKAEAVEVLMDVRTDFLPSIRSDSEVFIAAEGLLGQRYINISMGSSAGTPVADGGVVPFHATPEFSELVGGSADLLNNVNVLIKRLDAVVGSIDQGQGTIGKLLKDDELYRRLNVALGSAESIIADVNAGKGTLGMLVKDEQFYRNVNDAVVKLGRVADRLENGEGTVAKLINDPALYNDARAMLASTRTMVSNINEGKGTLGKLATDDELHRRLNAAVANLDTVLVGIRNGDGTVGKLFKDPTLYSNLNAVSTEMKELMGDFRRDPKKFLTIQLKIF